ncbi:MAG: iron-containing alcohol dehydrogenase [Chloroflexi bacterium]|nr:MAG: iron-containing alcohol dehydrogenase [Chloroflexota bacterium]
MPNNFVFYLPTRIIFGTPAAEALANELALLNVARVLLVSDPGLAELGLVDGLRREVVQAGTHITTFTGVSTNPTTVEVTAGLELARQNQVQAIIALGGGSPIDVGKAIAMLMANGGSYADYQWGGKAITRRSLPLLAVPTTAGTGSEVSKVAVIVDPENPLKKGVLNPLMFAHAAILDPELTRSLPGWLTAATGIDAFTHALETFIGRRANPYTDQLALCALRKIWSALPQAAANGQNLAARQDMMLAATWAGMAMDHAGLGLIHALSGPLTGHLHLHHGVANALLLPAVLRFNLPAVAAEKKQLLAGVMSLPPSSDDGALVEAVTQLVQQLGLPTHLRELNRPLDGVNWDAVAQETTQMVLIHNNPRPASAADCRQLLREVGA